MKLIFKLSVLLIFAFTIKSSIAQQTTLNNLYVQNRFLFNPANTGIFGNPYAFLNVKNQWAGFPGAPKTRTFGLHSMINESMGLGGMLVSDNRGHFTKFSALLAYSYRVKFNDDNFLIFGMDAGVENRELDQSAMIMPDPNDPVLTSDAYNHVGFGSGVGLKYMYKNKLQVDLAAPRLFEDYNPNDANDEFISKRELQGMLSYAFYASEDRLKIEPSVLGRYYMSYAASPLIDANLIVGWDNLFWLGTTYRTNGSFIFSGGFDYRNICLGYAYAYEKPSFGDVKSDFSQGTFEVFLAYHFKKLEKRPIDKLYEEDFAKKAELTPEQLENKRRLEELQKELDQLNQVYDPESAEYHSDNTLNYDPNRLEEGNYIVIYTFTDLSTVKDKVAEMREKEVKGTLLHNKTKQQYYIYTGMDKDVQAAISEMKEMREKGFKAWVLMY